MNANYAIGRILSIWRFDEKQFKLASVLALVCLPYMASPGQTQDAGSATAGLKEVGLLVTVRDKHGQVARNVSKDDLVLEEDGHPQTIRSFSQDLSPVTLGLIVDTSPTQRSVLDDERKAMNRFLDQMLSESKDRAFLIHFDREVELLQDVTSSREKLQSALESLKTASYRRENSGDDTGSSPDSRSGSRRMQVRTGNLLYDAVFLSSNELTKKQENRKALIVLSDGVDRGSKTSLESAIKAAQRADTIVYSILSADSHQQSEGGFERPRSGGSGTGWPGGGWPGGGGGWPGGGRPGGGRRGSGGGQRPGQEPRVDGKKILERISKETGGRFYEVSKKEPLDKIYAALAEDLRAQYKLNYIPSKDTSTTDYHKIKLEARNKNLIVQTREGYYTDH